jgi:hypothetical protein
MKWTHYLQFPSSRQIFPFCCSAFLLPFYILIIFYNKCAYLSCISILKKIISLGYSLENIYVVVLISFIYSFTYLLEEKFKSTVNQCAHINIATDSMCFNLYMGLTTDHVNQYHLHLIC